MAVVYNLKCMEIQVLKECNNGLEALQFVQQQPQSNIHFVLLDLDMPIMNGYDACGKIIATYNDFKGNKRQSSHLSILDDLFM